MPVIEDVQLIIKREFAKATLSVKARFIFENHELNKPFTVSVDLFPSDREEHPMLFDLLPAQEIYTFYFRHELPSIPPRPPRVIFTREKNITPTTKIYDFEVTNTVDLSVLDEDPGEEAIIIRPPDGPPRRITLPIEDELFATIYLRPATTTTTASSPIAKVRA